MRRQDQLVSEFRADRLGFLLEEDGGDPRPAALCSKALLHLRVTEQEVDDVLGRGELHVPTGFGVIIRGWAPSQAS